MEVARPHKTYSICSAEPRGERFGQGLLGHFFKTASWVPRVRVLRCFICVVPKWSPKWITLSHGSSFWILTVSMC